MEHNEYAIWRVKVRVCRRVREFVHEDETRILGTKLVDESLTILAPKGDLGRALIDAHLEHNSSWKYGDTVLLDSGKKVELLEAVEETLHTVIRFDDAYRGRM